VQSKSLGSVFTEGNYMSCELPKPLVVFHETYAISSCTVLLLVCCYL